MKLPKNGLCMAQQSNPKLDYNKPNFIIQFQLITKQQNLHFSITIKIKIIQAAGFGLSMLACQQKIRRS